MWTSIFIILFSLFCSGLAQDLPALIVAAQKLKEAGMEEAHHHMIISRSQK